jgi:hypothetical protein
MKYIRTKEGIYEFKGEYMSINKGIYYLFGKLEETATEYLFKNDVSLGKVVSQADTIEELCDIYVSVYEETLDNEFFEAYKYTPMEVKNFYPGYIPKEVYGSIWTDKGLIYVAKMNDKGELELL